MPLINRVYGGGGSSRAPITGVATRLSASQVKINLEKSLQNFKYLVLYAADSVTVSSSSRTMLSITYSVNGSDLPLKQDDAIVLTPSVFTAVSYGDVSILDGADIISLSYNADNVNVVIDSEYAQVYNFNQNVSYIYALLY